MIKTHFLGHMPFGKIGLIWSGKLGEVLGFFIDAYKSNIVINQTDIKYLINTFKTKVYLGCGVYNCILSRSGIRYATGSFSIVDDVPDYTIWCMLSEFDPEVLDLIIITWSTYASYTREDFFLHPNYSILYYYLLLNINKSDLLLPLKKNKAYVTKLLTVGNDERKHLSTNFESYVISKKTVIDKIGISKEGFQKYKICRAGLVE